MSYRFLLDENVPRSVFKYLESNGYDVEYVPSDADDRIVVGIARRKDLILVTRDSDFADEIRYPPGSHPGIIVLRIHPAKPETMIERLAYTLDNIRDFHGKTTIIYNDRIESIK
ncbi:MAG: DUF5615 family PIN-like protein [Desulfurococcales archaeon]|nr:DUF5615 family PIN-like protein [Desulfurococcales archaeon]